MHFTREQREAWTESTKDSPFNSWLRGRVSDGAGGLDLAALAAVASEYGIDASAYSHLNAGQQRMNVGNRLRKLVPKSVYVGIKRESPRSIVAPNASNFVTQSQPGSSGSGRTTLLPTGMVASMSNADLMQLYGSVIDELRTREVVRTGNAPLGDYAEYVFAKAFGWTLEGNSASGFDATDIAGVRFQIKARRLRNNTPGERQLSVIRSLPDTKFDVLAAVLFDRNFKVCRAALIPHAIVMKRAAFIEHVNGWRIILDDNVWNEPGVRDVTLQLAAVAI